MVRKLRSISGCDWAREQRLACTKIWLQKSRWQTGSVRDEADRYSCSHCRRSIVLQLPHYNFRDRDSLPMQTVDFVTVFFASSHSVTVPSLLFQSLADLDLHLFYRGVKLANKGLASHGLSGIARRQN